MKQFLTPLYDNLDTITSILGLMLGIVIASLYLTCSTIHLLTLGTALSLASLGYLIIRTKKESTSPYKDSKILKTLSEAAFFILFSLSLLLLHTSEGRPLFYFVLISLCAGLVAVSIQNVRTKWDSYLQIAKILMVSLNLRYSVFYQFEGSGVDYWGHLKWNDLLSQTGNIEVLAGKESFFPIMHIQVAINQIITDSPIKDASNFAVIIPLVISSVCVYLVARRYYGEKVGLLAILIVNITDFHILWGIQPQTTSFGLCLFYFILFVLFGTDFHKEKHRWSILLIILIPSIILTHAVSSFILFTTLFGLLAGTLIYKLLFNRDEPIFLIPIVILYGIAFLQHSFIALYSKEGSRSFFDQIFLQLNYQTSENAEFLNRPEAVIEYVHELPPLIERIANTMGLTILIFLSIIGCLFWLSVHYRNRSSFSMITCIILLLGITFGFPLFGIRNIIPSRWFAYLYFFLSIMAAFAVVNISNRFHKPAFSKVFTIIMIFSLTIFMTSCTISNQDSPLWLSESTISTTYTIQEVKGAETLSEYSENIFSDSRYGSSIIGLCCGIGYSSSESEKEILGAKDKIFVWRNYMKNRPVRAYIDLDGYYKKIIDNRILGKDMLDRLEYHDKIYQNDDITGYFQPNRG